MRRGDFTGALALFDAMTAEFPDVSTGYAGVGTVLLELGRFGEAVPVLEHALSLVRQPAGTLLPYRLAEAYVGRGEEARAISMLERYVPPGRIPAAMEEARRRVRQRR